MDFRRAALRIVEIVCGIADKDLPPLISGIEGDFKMVVLAGKLPISTTEIPFRLAGRVAPCMGLPSRRRAAWDAKPQLNPPFRKGRSALRDITIVTGPQVRRSRQSC